MDIQAPSWLPINRDPVIRRCLLLIVAVIATGVIGFWSIEGWSLWQSLFFTIVTLTTVGYGDYGLSPLGQRFTTILMVGGIAAVSYTGGIMIQRLVANTMRPEKRMLEQIKRLRGHFIVCGLGRTGLRVIRKLHAENAILVAIDSDEARIEHARDRGIPALDGDATADLALLDAGIKHAAGIAAVTSSDAINALICLTARAIAPDIRIIARSEDESSIRKLQRAGADIVISPASYGGDGIAENLIHPDVARLLPGLQGDDDNLQFAEIELTPNSPLSGSSIAEFGRSHPSIVFIASHIAGGDVVIRPDVNRTLNPGDTLIVAGEPSAITSLRAHHKAA